MKPLTIALTVLLAIASKICIGNADYTPTVAEQREALDQSRRSIENMEGLEANMPTVNNTRKSRRSSYFSPEALIQSRQAAVELGARQILSRKLNVPGGEIQFTTSLRSARSGESTLPPLAPCNSSALYRTNDGSCNNLNNPRYGQGLTINGRLLPASYDDGISTPRRAISGNELPSPRLISTSVLIDESQYTCNGPSLLTMQFGQFFDHDLTVTPQFKTSFGGEIICCQESNGQTGYVVPSSPYHPECLPIVIPTGDPVYYTGPFPPGCMEFTRSIYGVKLDGTIPRQREQINGVTHWIDGSMIYGTSDAQVLSLRNTTSGRGLMRTSIVNGVHNLPISSSCCTGIWCSSNQACAEAGDFRATEQPLLTVMHTIWLREHNRIANELFRLNGTSRNDEYYFQQARRIVIAQLQHIAYQEYLPILLGQLGARLSVAQADAPKKPNPAILSEFTTAAYRMGHSQLKSLFRLFEADGGQSAQSYKLADSFFDEAPLSNRNFLDNALRGLLNVPVQEIDNSFPADVTSQLFRQQGSNRGLDLVSLNIQRGRDHGLPTYATVWVEAQKFLFNKTTPLRTIDFLYETTSDEIISALKRVYESVEDIDLFIGGVTERPLPGALVGPTFAYVIYKQFESLRYGDRFFYDDLTKPVSFTNKQLKEIQKVTFSRILCDNNNGSIRKIQGKAFLNAGPSNVVVPCSQIPGMDLTKFAA